MFVGRTQELSVLEEHYGNDTDQRMVVVYGRRRIGKTALLSQFSQDKPTLWFTAREQNDRANLQSLAQTAFDFFGETELSATFTDWLELFRYIARKAAGRGNMLFVFDEFPYAAQAAPSLASSLQIALDHEFAGTGIFTVLCGSNEGFMENEVLGGKSPLYGRRSAQLKLKPFDLFEATELMPADAGWEERIGYYAALGGTPYYLSQLQEGIGFTENLERLCFNRTGTLYAEPEMLLREELREPAMYQSVLEAIAHGETKAAGIADRTGVTASHLSPYLKTLEALGIAERKLPVGDTSAKSRKGLYEITDPFFAYWYRFVAPTVSLIEMGNGTAAARLGTQSEAFTTYVGQQFEAMCMQWLWRQVNAGKLDLLPTQFGKWWGTDPDRREQTDIDIVMNDEFNNRMLFGECKWRNSFDVAQAAANLRHRSALLRPEGNTLMYLFSKYPVQAPEGFVAVDAETMLQEA